MKKILFLFALLGSIQVFSQDDEGMSNLNWLTDFDQAKKESIVKKKPILMFFTGSDWCRMCKSLKHDFFNTENFEKNADDFILLMVDIPRRTDVITLDQRKKNEALVSKYNKEGSYPNIVVLNDKLKVLGNLSGYTLLREIDTHVAFVDTILKKYQL